MPRSFSDTFLKVPKRSRSDVVHKAVIDELQKERLRQNLSRYRIAQVTGISLQGISLIERGQRLPTLHTLLRISEVLQIDLSEIIRRAEARTRGLAALSFKSEKKK